MSTITLYQSRSRRGAIHSDAACPQLKKAHYRIRAFKDVPEGRRFLRSEVCGHCASHLVA